MAYNNDQSESALPVNNQTETQRNSANLLPRFFRTPTNKKFLYSTLDQFLSPGTVEKISAFYGRKTAKAFDVDDNYISEISDDRQNYQLEPVVIKKDNLGNVTFYKDYVDYINQIKILGGNVDNHSTLNAQEYYSWNPNIDWDKFVNFREYYWLPEGPEPITITGPQQQLQSEYTVRLADNLDNYAYVLTPDGLTQNPTITLYKGITYKFNIDTPGMPFTIRTARDLNDSFLYDSGVDSTPDVDLQAVEKGTVTFTPSQAAPETLYYVSKNDINAYGLIKIASIEENSSIDVEKDVIGKKTFTLLNGLNLSNGMKVNFKGAVTPAKYATNDWHVEGVGEAIVLINDQDLRVPNDIADETIEGFDAENFDETTYEIDDPEREIKDYITIKRHSPDLNPWSRANKWVHRSVLQASSNYNNNVLDNNEINRAKRPIIEFDAGLKLFKFGTKAKSYVDVVDTFTADVFSDIEGATGYNVDGVQLVDGMRLLVTADTDILVKNRIFTVKIINFGGDGDPTNKQISLVEAQDGAPLEGDVVLVANGTVNTGKMYYYDGENWKVAQEKTKRNQCPLFDLCDTKGVSYSNNQEYLSTNFLGTKIFSYREGTGSVDVELGFPLSYRNVSNVGDIVFDFNLVSDSFTYQLENGLVTVNTDVAYLKKYTDRTTHTYETGWVKAAQLSKQMVVRQYLGATQTNNFAVDVYNNSSALTDLKLKVYVNNVLLNPLADYSINTTGDTAEVHLQKNLGEKDTIIIKSHSSANKNQNGFYEIATNFENNPFNDNLENFTFGEVNNHLDSIVEQLDNFTGNNPGVNNLRDIGRLSTFGTKFVQHSAPLNLALYHLLEKEVNVIKSIKFAQKEYDKFKKTFVQIAETSSFDGSIRAHVDNILNKMNKDKNSNMPFYFSDMFPYGAAKKNTFKVLDDSEKYFALSQPFSMNVLSNKAVQVYLNDSQLLHGIDYTFTDENFCLISKPLQTNDKVEIFEYEKTDGSYVPPTPTKLGLYPRFKPTKYLDDTLVNPVNVIQGHDGSLMVAFDDYKDDLILELEYRIYNNIKIQYNQNLRNIHDFIPGKDRATGHIQQNIDQSVFSDFIIWNSSVGSLDYTSNDFFDVGNSFTYNHSNMLAFDGSRLPGFWRAVYKQAYDTDRPHSHPWEMLGFSEQPTWWNQVYGPAPYTSDNLILWEDIQAGVIREPGKKLKYDSRYTRADLLNHLPVDEDGTLLSPYDSGYADNFIFTQANVAYKFGDQAPVETAWRRSSNYPFALLKAMMLNRPAHTMAINFDASRVIKNLTDQVIYSTTQKRIQLKDLIFPNSKLEENYVYTSGLINYISNYIKTDVLQNYKNYQNNLKNLTQHLGFKVKGFTQKEKFKLLLDSRSPLNQSNVFIPDENYSIHLNSSAPVDVLVYSGLIVEKLAAGFSIKGYDQFDPVFKYYAPIRQQTDPVKRVGGISRTFVKWIPNKVYQAGQILSFRNNYYRVDRDYRSSAQFDASKHTKLVNLPIDGGATAIFSKNFSKKISVINYGTILRESQDVVDFILGYNKYLESKGFIFENFNKQINTVENWGLSAQEFMFWTTQNWKAGAVLSMSPAANKLELKVNYSVADNIFDNFYDFAVLKADGIKLDRQKLSVLRQGNYFCLTTKNTADGIYFAKIPLIQKEHVVIVDNVTVFNDVIYDLAPGYRQDRIKVIGYVASSWDGSLSIPGFVYDEVIVKEWQPFTDYNMSDVVKYKQFYYSANNYVAGSSVFEFNNWIKLTEQPVSSLKPNFEYKTNQFTDFYDLDTDNFDVEQQKLAQHLIGYQKRGYLQNIINDDVAQYKFYQGFLQDKGTKNALSKLFDSLASANKDSIEFYEEWAIRTGQYGAAKGFDEVEYLLDETQFKLNPQPIELTDEISFESPNFVYKIKSSETYLKPDFYEHAPFPTKYFKESYVKTAGFVDPNDVNFTVKTYENILTINVSDLDYNHYVWVGFEKQSWNIYKHKQIEDQVTAVSESGEDVLVQRASNITAVQPNEIISVRINQITQLLKVKTVTGPTITCYKNGDTNEGSNGTMGKFISVKLSTLDNVNQQLKIHGKNSGELLWVEDDNDQRWVTLKNIPSWQTHQELNNPSDDSSGKFGRSLAVDKDNTTLVVADVDNTLHVYRRPSSSNAYDLNQNISAPTGIWTGNGDFGASIAISADGKYLLVGAPLASNTKSNYKGNWSENLTLVNDDIVRHNQQLWKVLEPIAPTDPSVDFTTFDSAAFLYDPLYNSVNNAYPDITVLLRGDVGFVLDATLNPPLVTNHMLIRASADQYNGTAVGDKLQLIWNQFNTSYPDGVGNVPFNGAILNINKAFIDGVEGIGATAGGHEIIHKVDEIISVDLTLVEVNLNDVLQTTTGSGTVAYRRKIGTRTLIYLKTVNGTINDSGTLALGSQLVGNYVKVVMNDYVTLGGWWYINLGFNTDTNSVQSDLKKSLVVRDIIKAGDLRTVNEFYNIFDTKRQHSLRNPTSPTPASEIALLSYYKSVNIPRTVSPLPPAGYYGPSKGIIADNRFVMRVPKSLSDQYSMPYVYDGQKTSLWVNSIRTGNPLQRYEITDLSENFTYNSLNNATDSNDSSVVTKEIRDIWNGFLEISCQLDANKYNVPAVGDIIKDKTTLSTAEVAFVKTIGQSGTNIQVYIKNKTGPFSLPTSTSDFRIEVINSPSLNVPPNTPKEIGKLLRTELESALPDLAITGASGTGTAVTLTFAALPTAPFTVGQTITVSLVAPLGYNGTYTVTACNNNSVSYASAFTSAYVGGGVIIDQTNGVGSLFVFELNNPTTPKTSFLDVNYSTTSTVVNALGQTVPNTSARININKSFTNTSIGSPDTVTYGLLAVNGGSDYVVNDQFTVSGTELAGTSPLNDCNFKVSVTRKMFTGVTPSEVKSQDQSTVSDGVGARFDIERVGANYVITTVDTGLNYRKGDIITIYGNKLGGFNVTNDLTFTLLGIRKVYNNITSNSATGIGIGARFDIIREGSVYSALVLEPGLNYQVGDQLTFFGNVLDGVNTTNNCVLTVAQVSAAGRIQLVTVTGTAVQTGLGGVPTDETLLDIANKVISFNFSTLTGGTGYTNGSIYDTTSSGIGQGLKVQVFSTGGIINSDISITSAVGEIAVTGATGSGTAVTLTFLPLTTAPFTVGQVISVTAVNPTNYNNTYFVTACTTSSVTFASTNVTPYISGGKILGTVIINFAALPSAPFTFGQQITVSGVTPTIYNGTYTVKECTTTTVSYEKIISTGNGTGGIVARNSVIVINAGINYQAGDTVTITNTSGTPATIVIAIVDGVADANALGSIATLQLLPAAPVVNLEYLRKNDLEYWFWEEFKQDGVSRSASEPSRGNKNYAQVFNIPLGVGAASSYTNEGAFVVYEKDTNGQYQFYNAYTTPDQINNARLGSKIKISQNGSNTTAFVSSALPDGGKIYFIDHNANERWHLGIDPKYVGVFSAANTYYTDDLVIRDERVYKSLTNQGPSSFNSNFWILLADVDYLGYVPNTAGPVLQNDSSSFFASLSKFAEDFDVSTTGGVLVANFAYASPIGNKVVVYSLYDGRYQWQQNISPPSDSQGNTFFASTLAVSGDGRYIAVGNSTADINLTDVGVVYIYKLNNGTYELHQTLESPQPYSNEQFGKKLDFDGNTLVISSVTRLDESSNEIPSGSIYIFENFNGTFLYADTFEYADEIFTDFGKDLLISNNHVYVPLPDYNNAFGVNGLVVDFRRNSSGSWFAHKFPVNTVNLEKIKSTFLYNTKTNSLVQRLDYIDPIQGRIAGIAEQELYYKTFYDPAVYSVATTGLSVDAVNSWDRSQVGRLWWDLSTVKFYDPYQVNIIFTTNYWNKLFPGSTVDVYEWVESKYLPSEWNQLAETKEGTAQGITGITKYGDTVYVSKTVYDNVSNSFSNRYYYWVKNKKTLPNSKVRKITALAVAQLIEDPKKQGYRFVGLLSNNTFSLYNCGNLLKDKDIAINFRYWTIDNQDINIHNEYQLISEGVSYSRPKKDIESVWFNSLIGYDEQFRPVPDTNLSRKYRYGTLKSPRQGWFVNRTEALKQVIERVNSVLIKNQIVSTRNLSRLTESQPVPSEITRLYDQIKDTLPELQFINTNRIAQAELSPVLLNGRIVDVLIVNAGYGYKVVPTYKITDKTGTGAEITLTIDNAGRINSAVVNKTGQSYSDSTTITVRQFSVLVRTDSSVNNKWAIHSWNENDQQWVRLLSQKYDVNLYWNYVDWYADGYNQFTEINHTVPASYQLQLVDDEIGNVIKIENIGTGGWLLLEKIDDQDNVDYTINYKTIGRQNGTIQFSKNLYDLSRSTVGYNGSSFDIMLYDSQPLIETRIILETVRDQILVDELDVEYNRLFFASLRYVFNEQLFVDWAFKSSFVTATHNVGELSQKTVFKNDNLSNYQDFIHEAKPYKTKVREYISSYESVDRSNTLTTDFDLPPSYDAASNSIQTSLATMTNNAIVGSNLTADFPNRHWLLNVGFKIESIKIADAGQGYLGVPNITISGGGGSGATAQAFVSNGRIINIKVTASGSGYLSAPNVIISGSQSAGGVAAQAVAILGESLVRSTHVRVKFDRTTGVFLITNLSKTENFVGNGSKFKYALKWPMNLKSNKVRVIVNQRPSLFSEYVYNNETDNTLSYTRSNGYVQFSVPPTMGHTISVQYEIDTAVLQAQDRINLLYEPETGQLGADLAQLLDGIDYGGVEISSVNFPGLGGFDSQPFMTGLWDSYDTTFDDEIFRLDASTNRFYLSQPLAAGVNYNVYKKGVSTHTADGSTKVYSYNRTVSHNVIVKINAVVLDRNLYTQDPVDKVIRFFTAPVNNSDIQISDTLPVRIDDPHYGFVGLNVSAVTASNNRFTTTNTSTLSLNMPIIFNGAVFGGIFNSANNPTVYYIKTIPSSTTFTISQTVNGSEFDVTANAAGSMTLTRPLANPNALMQTIVGDGSTAEVVIDEQLIQTAVNDVIVIRKSTSDGSFLPDPDDYDTLLSGGDLAYNTATGILAQDIVVDGDGFVTPTTSKGPEELVPGQVLDTVDIQVYDRSGDTGSRIFSYNHTADGVNKIYPIQTLPQSQDAVFVKVNNIILANSAFTTDYENKTVVLNNLPTAGSSINIITMGANGEKIVDIDTFVGDGSTFIFVTRAQYNPNYTSHVRVNGSAVVYVLDETDSGYQTPNRTLIKFAVPPAQGSVINYVIYASASKVFSEITYDDFVGDGSTTAFTLSQSPFNQQPLANNVIVKINNAILNAGYNQQFTVQTAVRIYALSTWQQIPGSISPTNIRAFLNGTELQVNDYNWNIAQSSVTLKPNIGINGDILKVYVINDGDYTVVNNTLTLNTAPGLGASVKVWQFSNHDIAEIDRINYDVIDRQSTVLNTADNFEYRNLTNGLIRLRRSAEDAQYVWVIVNGQLLTPNLDYRLSNNQNFVKIFRPLQQNDVVDVIHFAAPKYVSKFGFRQFKDMLNRTHYKRLGNEYKFYLTQDLYWYSQAIYLDTTGLTEPNVTQNKPGVIFVDGERIEYFLKSANKLEQLRRGTLGTGIKNKHNTGTEVFDQSSYQTVSYKDVTITDKFVGDGSTNQFVLSFTPGSKGVNEFEVFVEGRRLRKNSISSYNINLGMDSPAADVILPAEFTVAANSSILTLTGEPPAVNTRITVVRKIGKLWNDIDISLQSTVPLSQTENEIARFLRAKEVSLPQ